MSCTEQLKVARDRRGELAARGEAIAHDWYSSVAAQDASAFAAAVRESKNPVDLANAVRGWYWNFDVVDPGRQSPLPSRSRTRRAKPKASPRKAAPAEVAASVTKAFRRIIAGRPSSRWRRTTRARPLTWSKFDAPITRTQHGKQSLEIALRHRSLPLVDQTTHDDLVWECLDRTEHGLIRQ